VSRDARIGANARLLQRAKTGIWVGTNSGDSTMRRAIRLFMLVEALSFSVAALIHSGALIAGFEHERARIAEGVIAIVLFVGLALTWTRAAWTPAVGLTAQGFALLGTLVGVFMIAVGVGPRTVPDVVYHAAIVIVLACGLRIAARARSSQVGRRT
jgi:predicted tellurium resistance membrane protein TerC